MAVPKKKSSRSRRDQRRYSPENKLDPVTWVINPETQEPVRPHRVSKASLTDQPTVGFGKRKKLAANA